MRFLFFFKWCWNIFLILLLHPDSFASSFSILAVLDRLQSASGGITLGQWRRTNWYEWSSLLLVHIRIRMLKWITRVDTRPAFKDTGWTGPIERKPFLVLARSLGLLFFFFTRSFITYVRWGRILRLSFILSSRLEEILWLNKTYLLN